MIPWFPRFSPYPVVIPVGPSWSLSDRRDLCPTPDLETPLPSHWFPSELPSEKADHDRIEGRVFLAPFASIFDQAWGALQPLDEYVAGQGGTQGGT